MKKKIYFCDLTHNNGLIANDYIPLGCGYVCAYAKKLFGEEFSMDIFKFTDSFFEEAKKNPPDIFAGSFYVWNKNLMLLAAKIIKEINPNCLIVGGGLSFPLDVKRQKEFLLAQKDIDFLIPYDGEIGFANLLREYLSSGGDKRRIKGRSIEGVAFLNEKDELIIGEKTKRPKDLDIFPSPYLTGLLDKFFESGKFTPLVQSTRGCPYTCSYCWASNDYNRHISSFSLKRLSEELEYIAKIATKNSTYDLVFSDSNFGLYEKDFKILDIICRLQDQYGYPKVFAVPYEKKAGVKNIANFSKVKGVMYCLSTQSTDQKILNNVKREKMDLNSIAEYIKAVHKINKYIGTEIITGLPYETKETHMRTMRDLIDVGFDCVDPFTFMLLDGIELNSEESYKKFRYDIRYRLVPRNFSKIDGRYSFELEKVVIGTNSYDFQDYMYFRGIHGLLKILLNNGIYRELLQYIKQHDVHPLDWLTFLFEDLRKNKSSAASKCFDIYMQEAVSELWNSPEELISYYSKEENYQKLISREKGDNLLQKINISSASIFFDTYVNYFIEMTKKYFFEKDGNKNDEISHELSEIEKFISAKLSSVITNNIQQSKSFDSDYDIPKWIDEGFKNPLRDYRLTEPREITLELSDAQLELIKRIFARYDVDEKNPYGLYRTIPNVPIDNYSRKVKGGNVIKQDEVTVKI